MAGQEQSGHCLTPLSHLYASLWAVPINTSNLVSKSAHKQSDQPLATHQVTAEAPGHTGQPKLTADHSRASIHQNIRKQAYIDQAFSSNSSSFGSAVPLPIVIASTAQSAASEINDILNGSKAQQNTVSAAVLWDTEPRKQVSKHASAEQPCNSEKTLGREVPNLVHCSEKSLPIEPLLPFHGTEDMSDFLVPAKPVMKPGLLKDTFFTLPTGLSFVDKILPRPALPLIEHAVFPVDYYVDLHNQCSAAGSNINGQLIHLIILVPE